MGRLPGLFHWRHDRGWAWHPQMSWLCLFTVCVPFISSSLSFPECKIPSTAGSNW